MPSVIVPCLNGDIGTSSQNLSETSKKVAPPASTRLHHDQLRPIIGHFWPADGRICGRLSAGMTEDAARAGAGMPALVEHDHTIHDDALDPFRVLKWLFVSGTVDHLGGIEHDQI